MHQRGGAWEKWQITSSLLILSADYSDLTEKSLLSYPSRQVLYPSINKNKQNIWFELLPGERESSTLGEFIVLIYSFDITETVMARTLLLCVHWVKLRLDRVIKRFRLFFDQCQKLCLRLFHPCFELFDRVTSECVCHDKGLFIMWD